MTDNPYQPPASNISRNERLWPARWLMVATIGALAALTGAATFVLMTPGPNFDRPPHVQWFVFWVFPILSIILATCLAVGARSLPELFKRLAMSLRGLLFGVLFVAAGYLAFGITCCCTNGAIAGVFAPSAVYPYAIVTSVSVLVGSFAAYTWQHARHTKP